MNLERPALRLAGLAILMLCLILYDPDSAAAAHRLGVPLLMAAGAWALVQNVAVVTLGSTILAVIHSDLSATGWIERLAYPALALGGGVLLLGIAVVRFRRRIVATHAARWSGRQQS